MTAEKDVSIKISYTCDECGIKTVMEFKPHEPEPMPEGWFAVETTEYFSNHVIQNWYHFCPVCKVARKAK
jgi:hypothetical protein